MSSLETSITLDDVFTVVEAKRVPLAPELAGYLALEIADGTDAGSGDVDPKTVFISEEGTVALVRPQRASVSGDAEASVRSLLTKLLEASGSGTPALTTAAKRKPGNGLPALVEELEAALIPVNRSAGRRALARLVREVKRVLLGVGRNASVPPLQSRAAEAKPAPPAPHARPVLRKRESDPRLAKIDAPDVAAKPEAKPEVRRIQQNQFDEEPATAKNANPLTELVSNMNAVDSRPDTSDGASGSHAQAETPKAAAAAVAAPSPRAGGLPRPPGSLPPPPVKSVSGPPAPPPQPKREPIAAASPSPPEARPDPNVLSIDEVDSLLGSFAVSSAHGDKQMARELKAMAGLSPTPPPPDAKTLAELTKDVGKDLPKKINSGPEVDGVEALLALADASVPLGGSAERNAPPVAPQANLPPSPLFGGSGSAAAASAPGAPAALRQAEAKQPARFDAPAPPPPVREEAPAPVKQPEPPKPKAPQGPPPNPPASSKLKGSGDSKSTSVKRPRSTQDRPRAPKTGLALLVFALLVLAGGTIAIWKFAPQVFTGRKPAPPVATSAATSAVPPAPKCKVALVLTDVPANAEILLRMGQAPVDVERMPVGTRLELVATAEGYAPRRAIIKGDSPWDKGSDGKPRIEVPIQLDPSKAKPNMVDPWPAAEPGSQVGGSGVPGTVHVVSNVRGAEIWLLAGLGPEARIDQLRCDADIDVLLAGPPTLRRRLHVSDKDIAGTTADAAGNKVVNINAKDSAGAKDAKDAKDASK